MPDEIQSRQDEKDPAAVQLGRRGGMKGGPARAAKLTAERRREIARQGGKASARKRWTQDYADEAALEGIKTETRVITRSRDKKIRRQAFENAKGRCCVCCTDFSTLLDGRGIRVLQVHHRQQLAASDTPVLTTLADLAVVCANCHLLLHLDMLC